jgi:molecular chaperone GrpE
VNDINETAAPQDQANGTPPAEPAADAALAAAQAKAEENWNTYLRLAAEFDNFRKRADRELDNARKFAVERFAQELLPVGDALEMGLSAAAGAPGNALREGMEATRNLLHKALEKGGIKVIDPVGQPFDPAWHEAMVAQESTQAAPDTVLSVVQKGYSLNGRLLRPARVIVSKASGGN